MKDVDSAWVRDLLGNIADCFGILAGLGVIVPDLAERLKRMARFRDLIVHLYGQVDNRRVYQLIQHDLDDLDIFRQQVLDWSGS